MGGIEALFAALVIIFLLRSYFTKPKLPHGFQLPPGPPLIPLLGNALAVDVSAPWVTYKTWGSQYGKWFFSMEPTNPVSTFSRGHGVYPTFWPRKHCDKFRGNCKRPPRTSVAELL